VSAPAAGLGRPRLHLRVTDSTNDVAARLAAAGAPHGALVTAGEQRAGRGRQGRAWVAPAGRALLASVVLRGQGFALLPLAGGVAVAQVTGDAAQIKWPNDVLVEGRKVAGILAEGRPRERWAVLGIGLNVAVRPDDLPVHVRERAGTLGLETGDVEPTLERLLAALSGALSLGDQALLEAYRARDALRGRDITWEGDGHGRATGIDDAGRLLVELDGGAIAALDAGEVHLTR
jgi:BirA family transcriptional regulator, biotin operon repressor / biotin---[acetyl-CoA-carboxylase] ligase